MRLYEFQAKQVFAEYGIPIPKGRMAATPETAAQVASSFGIPVALKAQVLAGGRGLAGAIRFGQGSEEVREIAAQILRMKIGDERPKALLVEEKLEARRELYVGVTWDYQRKCAVVVASSRGGVDIESVAREHPNDVVRKQVDPFKRFSAYLGRELAAAIGLTGDQLVQYANLVSALWKIFEEHDAELVEVNPVAVLERGKLVALDAKLILDDKSIFRQSSFLNRIEKLPDDVSDGLTHRRNRARDRRIPTYIEMQQGNIGVVADGAGSGMLTLDLVSDFGGRTRVYCEMGGEATAQLIENALLTTMEMADVRVVLVNLIGGLNRMDEMARGITSCFKTHPFEIPIVVRMSGTMQDEGRRILAESGIPFFDSLYEAVQKAVDISQGV